MAARRSPWMVEQSRREAEKLEREKAERKARGNRVYAVLAWRPDARYSGKDVWRWFKRKADADKWALGFNQGQGVAVRDYTWLLDADADWIPERAARLVEEFVGSSARHHATKRKTPAELDRDIAHALSKRPQPTRSHATALESAFAEAQAKAKLGALEDAIAKALAKTEQSHRRHSIWLTRDGEYRVRPMGEKVTPLWFFVRDVPSEDELRAKYGR